MGVNRINPNISTAETLPTEFYKDENIFQQSKDKIFSNSWQFIDDENVVKLPNDIYPFTLLDSFLNEPLLLTRDGSDKIRCLSNVCTHRGNILVENPSNEKRLICGYHGRRFGIDGSYESMPEFSEAKDFPRSCDNLHNLPLSQWNQFLFTSINPTYNLDGTLEILNRKIGFLPINEFQKSSETSRDYLVNAHWALYCDNFLEGFHIPFVHKDLNESLDYGQYETLIYEYCSLQIGYSSDGTITFDLPPDHEDYGKDIAAYYFWLFPNLMLNFYPWGLSINIVKPIKKNLTRISYLTYIYDESKKINSAGELLDKVEREDEYIVENVQKGINSSFYKSGRFSPKREKGVHHFHSLIGNFLND